MVIDSRLHEFEHVFVAIGILMVIVGAVLGMKVFGPGGREAADLHEAGDESKSLRCMAACALDSGRLSTARYHHPCDGLEDRCGGGW
ncbi:MAG: hypothetical protein GY722_11275 [bacterium]|nr:hypothetical protein [bacterium]